MIDQEKEELLQERLSLIKDSVKNSSQGQGMFSVNPELLSFEENLAAYFEKCFVYAEDIESGKVKEYDISKWQKVMADFYAPILPENYETSYANPVYIQEKLGASLGAYLGLLYADCMALPIWISDGKWDYLVYFAELFVGLMVDLRDEEEETYAVEEIKKDLESFYRDYQEEFTLNSVKDLVSDNPFIYSQVMEADLSNPNYLYRYGIYPTDNELQIREYLNTLSQEEIDRMAHTYTEGYRVGFDVCGKDISKKSTVNVVYPIGFERVVRSAVADFKAMGLEPRFRRENIFSVEGRGARVRGVFSTAVNHQFDYDHKDDKGLYFDKAYINRREETLREAYRHFEKEAGVYSGAAYIEVFGEEQFSPVQKPEAYTMTEEQNKLLLSLSNKSTAIVNSFIPGEETSYTIIAFPQPCFGEIFPEVFKKTMELNTLDYMTYRRIQQYLIDALDQGEWVRVKGRGSNETNLRVHLHHLEDPSQETNFENCVADVNIPVGEVFTSPLLTGTRGRLHVSQVFLNGYGFKNLRIDLEDGMVKDYSCGNFPEEEKGKKFIFDQILFHHDSLPVGEFAIGTNTTAYRMAKELQIFDRLPILIAEKTGPHFALGDTCYSYEEEVPMMNPDGKEVIARENECSALRKEDPEKAYFHCHTDITIPFEELGEIVVETLDKKEIVLLSEGRFVLPGTEELNRPLEGLLEQ